ncbi:MAG: folylpolyglutamate synthase/dihydrofolate synthase family protein [Pseudomonadota bacterium]
MTERDQDQPEAIDELLDTLRGLHPNLIDLSLGRIEALLLKLGNPHQSLPPVIHVAGTNGKGSVTAFLVAILEAAGLRVHAYTSPHLVRFNERIAVPDDEGHTAPISDAALIDILTRVRDANADAPMTFFELTTAAAFLAFAEQPADAVVLEVGLGGRLDATNLVADPAVTVITQIAMDHADKLGGTLAEIASEKAGILKRGRPAIVGPQSTDARDEIFVRADDVGAPLSSWGVDFDAYPQGGRLVFQQDEALLDLPLPALRGRHQIINAGIAIAAVRGFARETGRDAKFSDDVIAAGLQKVVWPARMMPLAGGVLSKRVSPDDELWLDGGHNPAAGQAIAQALADLEDRAAKPTYLVCGMMGHKDIAGYLEPFSGLVRELVAVPVTGGMGTPLQPDALVDAAADVGLAATTAPSVRHAIDDITTRHAGPRRILICGSLYLAGNVLALERGQPMTAN